VDHHADKAEDGVAEIEIIGDKRSGWSAKISGQLGASIQQTVSLPSVPDRAAQKANAAARQSSTNRAVLALLQTVLSPMPDLAGRPLTPGAQWSSTAGPGLSGDIKMSFPCEYAGLSGVTGEINYREQAGSYEEYHQICISEAASLPLFYTYDFASKDLRKTVLALLTGYSTGSTRSERSSGAERTGPDGLDGLYVGTNPENGYEPVVMFFRPNGEVFLHPKGPASNAPEWGSIGRYEISPTAIRFTLTMHGKTQPGIIEFPFRRLGGGNIQLRNQLFERLRDPSGTRLNGSFEYLPASPLAPGLQGLPLGMRVSFTSDGRFSFLKGSISIKDEGFKTRPAQTPSPQPVFIDQRTGIVLGPGKTASGAFKEESGTYEINGYYITLRYSEGRSERFVFADRGRRPDGSHDFFLGSRWFTSQTSSR
jgi:hypothetical protein